MRIGMLGAVFGVLCVLASGGCASSSAADDDAERDGVADQELRTVSGVRMGIYKLEQTRLHRERGEDDFRKRQEGTFLDLTLSSDPSPVGRHGSFVARQLVKNASGGLGQKTVRGGFRVTTRRGVTSLELVASSGATVGKYTLVYVGDAMVLGRPLSTTETFEIFLQYRGDGPAAAPVTGRRCEVKEIEYDSVFEEGLSVDEYPDVSFSQEAQTGKWAVSIGSWSITDGEDGDRVEVRTEGDKTTTTVTSGSVTHKIVVSGATGTLTSTENGDEVTAAKLHRCRQN